MSKAQEDFKKALFGNGVNTIIINAEQDWCMTDKTGANPVRLNEAMALENILEGINLREKPVNARSLAVVWDGYSASSVISNVFELVESNHGIKRLTIVDGRGSFEADGQFFEALNGVLERSDITTLDIRGVSPGISDETTKALSEDIRKLELDRKVTVLVGEELEFMKGLNPNLAVKVGKAVLNEPSQVGRDAKQADKLKYQAEFASFIGDITGGSLDLRQGAAKAKESK